MSDKDVSANEAQSAGAESSKENSHEAPNPESAGGSNQSDVQSDILADLESFAAEHAAGETGDSSKPADSNKTGQSRGTGGTGESPEPAESVDSKQPKATDDTEPGARRERRAAIDPFSIPDEFAAKNPSLNASETEPQPEDASDSESTQPADQSGPPPGLLFQAPSFESAQPEKHDGESESERHDDSSDDSDMRESDMRESDQRESESGGNGKTESSNSGSNADDQEKRPRRKRGGRGRRGRSKDDDESDETQNDGDSSKNEGSSKNEKSGQPDKSGKTDKSGKSDKSTKDDSGKSDKSDKTGKSDDSGNSGSDGNESNGSSRRRRRRRRGSSGDGDADGQTQVSGVKGSTRLEAKRQRRREGREAGRRRPIITEAEFLARRESVDRQMVVRQSGDLTQIAVLEDKVVVEHYVSQHQQASLIGNVYLGKVQNVLPSMEAAFVDIGRGRNAVLYAGEVNWDATALQGKPRRIEQALSPGDPVLVQVTKDPIGHKGARLTSQISMPGRFLVYVPGNSMTGISRKLPDTERSRLKKILRSVLAEDAGVIVRTAAEGASEDELTRDVERLSERWAKIVEKSEAKSTLAPELLYSEPDLTVRVIRDVFNEDFKKLTISGDEAWNTIHDYVESVAPDLLDRVERWDDDVDVFEKFRIDEQITKTLDRKVNLPSGGSLVIDRTEAMTVVDVNTGKFTGSGGNLEETVTKNNLEAAEEVVRQLRLRDIGGIIVIDFIDMVLESNRDLVQRRLIECLGRDRTKHQVAEVTSLGLVQMTRKRIGTGLVEAFSEPCEHCGGRGLIMHNEPSEKRPGSNVSGAFKSSKSKHRGRKDAHSDSVKKNDTVEPERDDEAEKAAAANREAVAKVAAAAKKSHEDDGAENTEPAGQEGGSAGSKKRGSGKQNSAKSGSGQSDGKSSKKRSKQSTEQTKSEETKPTEPEQAGQPEPPADAPLMFGVGAEPAVVAEPEPKPEPKKQESKKPAASKDPASQADKAPAGPVLMLGMDSSDDE